MTKHEAAFSVLKSLNKPSSYKEIHEQIKIRSLTEYKEGVDEPHITRNAIEKKCINSTLTGYPKSEILFYRNDEGYYDLYEKLTEIEKKYFEEKDIHLNDLKIDLDHLKKSVSEINHLKEKLHQSELEVEKLKNLKLDNESFENNYKNFTEEYENFKNTYNKTNSIFRNFDENIKETNKLFEKLDNTKHGLNFNVFSKSFNRTLSEKRMERDNQNKFLIGFGLLIIIVPLISIFFNIKENLYMLIPLATIEVFLVYYFKLFLHNYNSLKEQILQIETKVSLLEFITGYIDFKIKNKIEQDQISGFEEIIFSKISPNMKTIPTSPDVISLVEKVAKIIKSK